MNCDVNLRLSDKTDFAEMIADCTNEFEVRRFVRQHYDGHRFRYDPGFQLIHRPTQLCCLSTYMHSRDRYCNSVFSPVPGVGQKAYLLSALWAKNTGKRIRSLGLLTPVNRVRKTLAMLAIAEWIGTLAFIEPDITQFVGLLDSRQYKDFWDEGGIVDGRFVSSIDEVPHGRVLRGLRFKLWDYRDTDAALENNIKVLKKLLVHCVKKRHPTFLNSTVNSEMAENLAVTHNVVGRARLYAKELGLV